MEIGANRRSLGLLGLLIAVLAFVVYFQFFTEDAPSNPKAAAPARTGQAEPSETTRTERSRGPASRRTGGRFQPRLGSERTGERLDPMTAASTLRTDLLDRVQGIVEPTVERDIFNFGRPKKPEVAGPTREEAQLAQSRLDAAVRTPVKPPKRPVSRPKQPPARPPNWKYFGQANDPGSLASRAFLLDGEEILVAAEGSMLQGRYRLLRIDPEQVVVQDTQAGLRFSLPIEASE